MKKSVIILLYLLLMPFTVSAAQSLGFSKEHPLLFGIDMDYPPLEYIDSRGNPRGLDVNFTIELLNRMNIPFTFQPNSWSNISDDVINQRVDLAMMVFSPYRQHILNYSRAVFRLYYQAVYRQEADSYFDMRNLKNKEVAYMASRPVTDTLVKAGAHPVEVRDLTQAMKELSAGKYDAVICFRYQAKYIIETHSLDNLTTEDLTLTPREYCYVSKNKELIDSINKMIIQMKAEGRLNAIYGEDVLSEFGRIEIPVWVWFLLLAVSLVAVTIVLILQLSHSRRLRREAERAVRSERLKTVILGNVSHALHTPLNAIIGFSEVLKNNDENMLQEERNELYNRIYDNGSQLNYFFDELLQLSNIETSNRDEETPCCQLADVMAECRQEVEHMKAEGVTLNIQTTPLMLRMAPEMLKLLAVHLLKNALKFTKEGSVELGYTHFGSDLRLEVRDTGPGLPEHLRENIFKLMENPQTFTNKISDGLGLSICRSIVEKYYGTIDVISEPGKGCTFWILIPQVVVSSS
jgi:signal transduction histidine kinase